MANYSENTYKCQGEISTPLSFWIDGIGIEWFDVGLPHPNHFSHTNKGYYISWDIRGHNNRYVEELKVRFVQTFEPLRVEEIRHKLPNNNLDIIYDLKDFKALQSLKARAKNIVRHENLFTCDDEIFLHLKFYFEYLIKRDKVPIYSDFEKWALKEYKTKEKSTIRAKCRSIYNWYSERDFKCGRVNKKFKDLKTYWESTMATRKEHIIKVNKKKGEEVKRKVLNCITGLYAYEYKKPNGMWNVTKIAKESGVTRDSVYKYLPKDSLF